MPVAAKDRLGGSGDGTSSAENEAMYRKMMMGKVIFRSYCYKKLKVVPAEVLAHDTLEKLWLHNNMLTSLPTGLTRLRSLRILTLSRNRALGDGLWDACGALERLETLEVSDCGLAVVPAGHQILRVTG